MGGRDNPGTLGAGHRPVGESRGEVGPVGRAPGHVLHCAAGVLPWMATGWRRAVLSRSARRRKWAGPRTWAGCGGQANRHRLRGATSVLALRRCGLPCCVAGSASAVATVHEPVLASSLAARNSAPNAARTAAKGRPPHRSRCARAPRSRAGLDQAFEVLLRLQQVRARPGRGFWVSAPGEMNHRHGAVCGEDDDVVLRQGPGDHMEVRPEQGWCWLISRSNSARSASA